MQQVLLESLQASFDSGPSYSFFDLRNEINVNPQVALSLQFREKQKRRKACYTDSFNLEADL